MHKFGLNEKEYKIINDIFKSYAQIDEVVIFGSRALNTYKTTSDIDFAIKGKDIAKIFGKLKDNFEESSIMFEVDIVDYNGIKTEKLLEHIDRFGVLFYRKGWEETTLEDIISDIAMGPFGSNLKVDSFTDHGVPIIKGGNLSGNYVSGKFSYVSEEKADSLKRSIAHPDDIIITHRGTLGQVSLVPTGKFKRYVTSQSQLRFTPDNKKVDKKYLLYFFKSRLGQYELLKNASQVGVPAIATPTKAIKSINLLLPSLPEQKSIADNISAFDDKIELLQEQNKVLETTSQTIFKEWFVNFNFPGATGEMVDSELGEIPKGWRVTKIKNICKVGSSKRIFSKDYVNNGVPFYRGKEIIEKSKGNDISTELFITKKQYYEIEKKYGVPQIGDILLTSVGTLGVSYLVSDEEFYFKDGNLTWFKDFKLKELNLILFLLFNSKIGRTKFDQITIGSTQKALTITALNSIKLVLPDEPNLIKEFYTFTNSIMNKIKMNITETQLLSQTRDSLLPKLMSGEIRVLH